MSYQTMLDSYFIDEMMQKLKANDIKTQYGRIPDDTRIDNDLISAGKTMAILIQGVCGEYDRLRIMTCNIPNDIDITTETGMSRVADNYDNEFCVNFSQDSLLDIDLEQDENAEYNNVYFAVEQCYNIIMQHLPTSSSSHPLSTERV